MMESKNALRKIIEISLLSASCLMIKQEYEANATNFTRRVSSVFSSIIGKHKTKNYKPLSSMGNGKLYDTFNVEGFDESASTNIGYRLKFRADNNLAVGENTTGDKIRIYSGIKLNFEDDILNRDVVLKDIKNHLYRNQGHSYSRTLFYELLNYEPNISKRNDEDMTRMYKHISSDGSIRVSVYVDHLGDFNKLIIRTDGKKHTFIPSESRYKVE